MSQNYFGWRFPILDGGKRQGINDSGIATFAGEELYDNLAREICQNSLDAKDNTTKEPVIVSFQLKTLYKDSFTPIGELKTILEKCKEYWKDASDSKLGSFLQEAFNSVNSDSFDLLIISDYNTNGLNGSRNRTGAWDALTGSNGVSCKLGNSQGSYGIGKNAPYACSSLRTIFYNTYSKEDNDRAFQGVASLVTHLNDDGEETQGCGFYYNKSSRKPIFEEDNSPEFNIFKRDKYGTDIIILGFKKNLNWKNDIKNAIIKNFFISILKKKLVVYIDDLLINHETLEVLLKESLILNPNDPVLARTKNYCETFNQADKIFTKKLISDNDVKLYVKVSEEYSRHIALLRSTGMIIREKALKKMKPYQAVFIVEGDEMNSLLKLMEPPKHDKWDYKLLPEDKLIEGRRYIGMIDKFISDSIETLCKMDTIDEIDPDGISAFLPDDSDFINQKNKRSKTKVPQETVEIENVKKKKFNISDVEIKGQPTIGEQDEGDVHNDTSINEEWDGEIPDNGIGGNGNRDIVDEDNKGKKIIEKPLDANIRLIPSDYKKGLYNFVVEFKSKCNKCIINFRIIGEDGNTELLNVLGYKISDSIKVDPRNYYEIVNITPGMIHKNLIKLDVNDRIVIMVGGTCYEIIE